MICNRDFIRNSIKAFAIKNMLSFFDPRAQKGLLRTMMIRITSAKEIMIVVQFFEDDRPKRELLLDHIIEKFPEITSLQYIINKKANDTIYDQDVILYYGRDHIIENMEGLEFKINTKSFYQTNSNQAYELYKIARDFSGLTGNELVYDLYTGTGTIAQFISKKAKKIIGIESVPEAIIDAKENAILNKINNVEFFVGDDEKPDVRFRIMGRQALRGTDDGGKQGRPNMSWSVPLSWFWVMPRRIHKDRMTPSPVQVVGPSEPTLLEGFQEG